LTRRLIHLTVIALLALTGCSVAKPPVIDRNTVLRLLYAQRKEMAAEVEYKKYLMEKNGKTQRNQISTRRSR